MSAGDYERRSRTPSKRLAAKTVPAPEAVLRSGISLEILQN
jgi:hypothetical protein